MTHNFERLRKALSDWQEASVRPGILSRAGHRNVLNMTLHVSGYFKQMASMADLSAPANHYGLIEPHIRRVISHSQPLLLATYKRHAKIAYLMSGSTSVFAEAGADISLPIQRSREEDLYKQLDKLGLTGQQAVDYINERGATLVKGIDAYTLTVLRAILSKGIEDQIGVDGTMRLIREELVDMSRWRAQSIATTEMNDAMSEASFQKIQNVGLDGKRWIRSPGACPICEANAAQGIIPVGQPFQSGHMRPPGHPGKCRCAVAGARLANAESFDASRNVGK